MTEQEKKINKNIENSLLAFSDESRYEDKMSLLVNNLIKEFPQILAEKVWEGREGDLLPNLCDLIPKEYKHAELFIREVVS